jgi:hypothetical protein
VLDDDPRIVISQDSPWFREGLATYASGGGGTETITDEEARQAIRGGRRIIPLASGSLFVQRSIAQDGVPRGSPTAKPACLPPSSPATARAAFAAWSTISLTASLLQRRSRPAWV